MKRYLLVVVVAVLAISAQPAAAQNASAVASEHTTFGTGSAGESAPTTLQNMSVQSSGESASIGLSNAMGTIESVEDGDLKEYGGDTGAFTTTTSVAADGSTAIESSGKSGNYLIASTTGLSSYPERGDNISARLRAEQQAGTMSFGFGMQDTKGWDAASGYLVLLNPTGNADLYRLDSGTLTQLASIGDFSFDAFEWYRVDVAWRSGGAIAVNIYNETGAEVASNEVTDETYDSGGIAWHRGGQTSSNTYQFDYVQSTKRASAGRYVGAPHDAESVSAGWTNVTLQNASATATWQQDADADGVWTNVTSTTVSATTNVTQDLSGTTSDRWRVRVDFEKTGSSPVAELHDEGVLFASSSPTLSDAEPPDQAKIENAVGNVSINVSDGDFPLAQSDSVTVSATDDEGNSLGSTTLTSNGTASLSYSSEAGANTIQWTATDAHGNSDTFTQSFETPSRLTLYNETSPSQKVETSTDITATFFGASGERVIQRTSSDATFNFSGLPTDTQYIVTVDAEGYRERTLVIDSLYEQQSFYLLANSVEASQIVFELSDPTGEFPPGETRLFVEKPVKINGSTAYRTVAADTFGATSAYSVVLAEGARYRLRIRHDGQERILGSYTPTVATTEPLRVQRIEPSAEDVPQDAVYGSVEDGQLAVRFRGGDNDTAVRYRVTNSSGDVVVPETETTGASFAHVYPVANNTTDSYNVSYEVVDGGETVRDGSFTTGDVAGIAGRFNMDGQLLSLLSWFAIMATLGLVVIVDTRLAPAAGTGMASALTILGTVAIPAPLLGVSGVVAVLALFGRPS